MKTFTQNEIRDVIYEKLWHTTEWQVLMDKLSLSKDAPHYLVSDLLVYLIESFELSIDDVYYNASS